MPNRKLPWRILIVDDSFDDRADMRQMLLAGSERRFTFVEAERGDLGVRLVREARDQPFDCVLLDFLLPDIDAPDVLNAICEGAELPPCPIVIITGADQNASSGLLHAGAQDFLGKSWLTPASLTRAIENAVERFAMLTERKQSEESLRKSELKFRALIEATPDAILIVDEQSRIVLVNELTTKLFGYKRPELMGQSLALLLPERFRKTHHSHFLGFVEAPRNRAMGGGLELWGQHKDGGEFPIEVSLSPLETEQGTLIFSSIRDITERKRTEKTTQLSEIRYRRLFEAAKDGVLLLDPETRKITDANPFMTTLLGYPHSQLVGKELFEIGLLKDELASQEMFEKLKYKLQVRYEDLPLESQEGKRQEVEVVANLYDENGHAVIQCNIRDITERKRAEEELHASEGRFRVLAESVPQFIWISNTEGVVEYINPQWTEYTGLSLAQTSTHQDESVYHSDDKVSMYAAWNKALQTSTPYSVEVRIRSAHDGGFRWFLTRGIPQYDRAGTVIRWFGVTTDIEDQKQAQARSADRNTLLQRAVAESHHRIKNNLQVLSALVELQVPLQGDTVPVSELKRIGQHIRTLAALHDLLTIDSKTGVDLDTVSLKAALEKLAPILQATSGERKVLIQADEMVISLKQGGSFTLLVNELVSNALKHGKGDVQVTLTLLPEHTAQLEVCDDGPGFPPGFDPQKSANTGIELIESMGRWDLRGEILYQNRPAGGVCVLITFPLVVEL
jgi:PAS domain S-box-containing protein